MDASCVHVHVIRPSAARCHWQTSGPAEPLWRSEFPAGTTGNDISDDRREDARDRPRVELRGIGNRSASN
jgi:hypothetical protein